MQSQSAYRVDLETARALLALPRELGKHPETGEMILAGIGRFGPYLKHGSAFRSLGKDDDVLTIGLNRAVSLLAEPAKGRRGGRTAPPGRKLGDHPEDSQPVTLHDGRYGPYVKHGKINATLPKNLDPASLSLEDAVEIIEARAQRSQTKAKSGNKASSSSKTKRAAKGAVTKAKATAKSKTEGHDEGA